MTEDEIVIIKGLYAYIDVNQYNAYLRRSCDSNEFFFEEDMPMRVNTLYPATHSDSCWISVTNKQGTSTAFPIDLVERFTNVVPEWDKNISYANQALQR